MKPYWIVILFLFWIPISPAQAQHTAGPMSIFINGVNFETFLTDDNLNLKGEELQRAFRQYAGFSEDGLLTGQELLISNALESILEAQKNGISADPDYSKMHEKCREAYDDKVQWHIDNNDKVPYAFGKIIYYALEEHSTSVWTGLIVLCTWIGSVNYYFEIEFVEDLDNSMALHESPFAGTLDTTTLPPGNTMQDYINQWEYKLHARQGAINYRSIWQDNMPLLSSHQFYNDLPERCFDMFYSRLNNPTGPPTGDASDLANQLGYCMGRCDAKVMNTGD